MKLLQYNDLDTRGLDAQFNRTVQHLNAGDFEAADVKKMQNTPYYRAKLNDADRLLFRFGRHNGQTYLLLLEVIRNHAYHKSRFLGEKPNIDEDKLAPVPSVEAVEQDNVEPIPYVNPEQSHFHILDKILSFDEAQVSAYMLRPPVILIGSAGSGKTVLTLEKLKGLTGDALYVTRSAYLAENARNLYYAYNYENENQDVDFLSFQEFLETIRVPEGKPVRYADFAAWFQRHAQGSKLRDAHKVFEEFNGVLTGNTISEAHLTREEYLQLGVRQSIFLKEEREKVYELFLKYLDWIKEAGFYDPNMTAFAYLPESTPRYDSVVIDEVQDITNVQIQLVLKSLRRDGNFLLCGDSNQIVHPNFFSWANVKSMFWEQRTKDNSRREILRILDKNYRNSRRVTELANRLLLIKNSRFGSIDKESNYLITCNSDADGQIELFKDEPRTAQDLNTKTSRSTRFAVMVMRDEDKDQARKHFKTPLLFSVQEAKGLEYENIILYNFISDNRREFDEIIAGVTPDDLNGELQYARPRDKTDKSAEAYKFYINALYVALTRSFNNVYIIEDHIKHRLWQLLGLASASNTGKAKIQTDKSTTEEWKEEARKLEKQGKTEQAESIRRDVLEVQEVPWRVITPESLTELKAEALDPERFNRQAKLRLFEYAVIYDVPYLFDELAALNFKDARNPEAQKNKVLRKYTHDYRERSLQELKNKINKYGVDFRDSLNRTPLMIAAELGMPDLVRSLVESGAHREERDNWGRTPLQIALRQAYLSQNYAKQSIGRLYPLLAPTSIKVKVQDRMIKIDKKMMEFFLLQSMLSVFQEIVRTKIKHDLPAFETGDFYYALEHFPEQVIPERRKKRPYLSSVLAKNEVNRPENANRMLFVRVRRGYYILNPNLDIEIAGEWVNVYDLLHISTLENESENQHLQPLLHHVRFLQKKAPPKGKQSARR